MSAADDQIRAGAEPAELTAPEDEDFDGTVGPVASAPALELSVSYPVPTVCVVGGRGASWTC